MVKYSLASFRTTSNECGSEKTVRLGADSLFPLDDIEIPVKDLMEFTKTSCCPDRNKRCVYCEGYCMWRNLARGFNCHFDGDKFWYSSGRHECASVYINGGKPANKLHAEEEITITGGTVIYFRPEVKERSNPFMVNMEFRVIASYYTSNDNDNAPLSPAAIATTGNPFLQSPLAYNVHVVSISDTRRTIVDTYTIMDNATAKDATATEDATVSFSCPIHEYHDHMRIKFAAELEEQRRHTGCHQQHQQCCCDSACHRCIPYRSSSRSSSKPYQGN